MTEQLPSTSPKLNEAQAAAVSFGSGALRIMAGAGAGKTYTLTHSIVALIERGLATPSQILAMTFTTKAAEELRGRINTAVMALTDLGETVDVDTYHAFGGRIVAEHGYRLNLPPEPLVLTPAESWIVLWRALDRIQFKTIDLGNLRGNGFQPSPLKAMLDLGSRLADERRALAELDALIEREMDPELETEADYLRALTVYEEEKRRRGAIDYGDQISIACDLLKLPAVR
jgi:DNA helicase-2/ATP-dependent DNA helicase PcrA